MIVIWEYIKVTFQSLYMIAYVLSTPIQMLFYLIFN